MAKNCPSQHQQQLTNSPLEDDRIEYASLQTFLYGPYLLAGLSTGDWDINIEPNTSLLDYFTPIPSNYDSSLITLAQESEDSIFVLINWDQLITMQKSPQPGTDVALKATSRVLIQNSRPETRNVLLNDTIGKSDIARII